MYISFTDKSTKNVRKFKHNRMIQRVGVGVGVGILLGSVGGLGASHIYYRDRTIEEREESQENLVTPQGERNILAFMEIVN